MSSRPFEAHNRIESGAAVIDLHGDIDAASALGLNAAFEEASQTRLPVILLNFADVDYINSTGIALIVSLLAKARKAGQKLLTCSLNDHYTQIFQITRLADFMGVYPDEASALQGASARA